MLRWFSSLLTWRFHVKGGSELRPHRQDSGETKPWPFLANIQKQHKASKREDGVHRISPEQQSANMDTTHRIPTMSPQCPTDSPDVRRPPCDSVIPTMSPLCPLDSHDVPLVLFVVVCGCGCGCGNHRVARKTSWECKGCRGDIVGISDAEAVPRDISQRALNRCICT